MIHAQYVHVFQMHEIVRPSSYIIYTHVYYCLDLFCLCLLHVFLKQLGFSQPLISTCVYLFWAKCNVYHLHMQYRMYVYMCFSTFVNSGSAGFRAIQPHYPQPKDSFGWNETGGSGLPSLPTFSTVHCCSRSHTETESPGSPPDP